MSKPYVPYGTKRYRDRDRVKNDISACDEFTTCHFTESYLT